MQKQLKDWEIVDYFSNISLNTDLSTFFVGQTITNSFQNIDVFKDSKVISDIYFFPTFWVISFAPSGFEYKDCFVFSYRDTTDYESELEKKLMKQITAQTVQFMTQGLSFALNNDNIDYFAYEVNRYIKKEIDKNGNGAKRKKLVLILAVVTIVLAILYFFSFQS